MDAAAWIAVIAAGISLGGIIPASLQVKSMKQQTEIQQEQTRLQAEIQKDSQRPFVWLDFCVNPVNGQSVHLVLKNEGPTVAENIRVECEPQMRRTKNASQRDGTDEIPLFSSGVTSMPPGRQMRWFVGVGPELSAEGKLDQHKIKISYDGPFGPEKPVEYRLSSLDLKEITIQKEGSLAGVESAVRDLKKIIPSLKGIEAALEATEE